MACAFNKLPAGAHRLTYLSTSYDFANYNAYYIHTLRATPSPGFSNINITGLKSQGLNPPSCLPFFLPYVRALLHIEHFVSSGPLRQVCATYPGFSPSLFRATEGDSHYNRTRVMASVRRKSTNNIYGA